MKIRNGFVSNSSSSSFVCNTGLHAGEVEFKLGRMLDMYNELFETNLLFDEIFAVYQTGHAVTIRSVYDNSIPFELFDLIKCLFDATYCHQ